jgi:hypothetical protein
MRKIKIDRISSVARNVPFNGTVEVSDHIEPIEGNLVVVQALEEKSVYEQIELADGRSAKVLKGDIIVGALGERKALKGYKGGIPREIKPGDVLHLLNLGGVIGNCTSGQMDIGEPLRVEVIGQVVNGGHPINIKKYSVEWKDHLLESAPIIMISGTCMECGKTTVAAQIIHELKKRGFRLAAAKLTGVSLMRDIFKMQDYGAVKAYIFTDAGLPSTTNQEVICPASKGLISKLNEYKPDFVVLELGDGLLGEYGVQRVLKDREIMGFVKVNILCANDSVGVYGAIKIFEELGLKINIVCGPATDNDVGVESVEKQFKISAANARTTPERLGDLVFSEVTKH